MSGPSQNEQEDTYWDMDIENLMADWEDSENSKGASQPAEKPAKPSVDKDARATTPKKPTGKDARTKDTTSIDEHAKETPTKPRIKHITPAEMVAHIQGVDPKNRPTTHWIPIWSQPGKPRVPYADFPTVFLDREYELENNTVRFSLPEGWNTKFEHHRSNLTMAFELQITGYCKQINAELNPSHQIHYTRRSNRQVDCTFDDWRTFKELDTYGLLEELVVVLPAKNGAGKPKAANMEILFATKPVPNSVITIFAEGVPIGDANAESVAHNLATLLQPHSLACYGVYASGMGTDEKSARKQLDGGIKVAIKIAEHASFPTQEAARIPGYWRFGGHTIELQFRGRFQYCTNCKDNTSGRQGKHTSAECTNYSCRACRGKGHRQDDERCPRHPSRQQKPDQAAK